MYGPSTQQLREWWGPPCKATTAARVKLNGAGSVMVRGAIVEAVKALNACLVAWHYATRAGDTGAYNCRRITNGTGYSLHAYLIALDINWSTNPYGPHLHTDMPPAMIEAIKAIRTKSGARVWRWGGDYSGNKDAMHFEIICSPADLAHGIDPATLPKGARTSSSGGYVAPAFPGQIGPHQGNGPSIKRLQQLLIDADLYHGPVDGKWSSRLGDGVEAVERAHDGILFAGGVSDLSQYWGTYRGGVGTFSDVMGPQKWAFASYLAKVRKAKR